MSRRLAEGFATTLVAAFCLAIPLAAQEHVCPGGTVVVQGGGEQAQAICETAALAKRQLASCNLPVTRTVTVEVTRTLPGNCYGLYYCDNDLIQLLPVDVYATYLLGHPESPFGHLAPEVFFDSILRHELAHAALRDMPCPYEGCPATQEFVAFNMQIRFLSDIDRAPFERFTNEIERPISREGVNALVLMMSPETFVRNAYAYLSQQNDPCGLMGEIVGGDVLLDLPFR